MKRKREDFEKRKEQENESRENEIAETERGVENEEKKKEKRILKYYEATEKKNFKVFFITFELQCVAIFGCAL